MQLGLKLENLQKHKNGHKAQVDAKVLLRPYPYRYIFLLMYTIHASFDEFALGLVYFM